MTIFGSILINRQIKGLLACDDFDGIKAKEHIAKLIVGGKDSVEKLLEAIPHATTKQKKIFQYICDEILKTTPTDVFLDEMENDQTQIRVAAKNILFGSQSINPSSLLDKLTDPNTLTTEIIDVVEVQKQHLKPEQLIRQALKMSGKESARLFKMANEIADKFDIENYDLQASKVDSPDKKLHLLDFLALIKHPKASEIAQRFLDDSNQMIKISTLNTLRSINEPFDVSHLLKNLGSMKGAEKKLAVPLILSLADAKLIGNLAPLLNSVDKQTQNMAAKLIIQKATTYCFRRLLIGIEKLDGRGRTAAINLLVKQSQGSLEKVAKPLLKDGNESIRKVALRFLNDAPETGDFQAMADAVLNDNAEIREKAIAMLGESKQKESLKILAKAFKEKPESALSILKAVAALAYSKGLEIAIKGLDLKGVAIQKESLKTIRLLANEKHAQNIQDILLKKIPTLDKLVRDTVENVLKEINQAFQLKPLPDNLEALLKSDVSNEKTASIIAD